MKHRSEAEANFKLATAYYASLFVDQCMHSDFLLSRVDSCKGVVKRDQLNNFRSPSYYLHYLCVVKQS